MIKAEDNSGVELEVSGGLIKFSNSEINKIVRSSPDESASIRQKIESDKKQSADRMKQRRLEEERKPRDVEFSSDSRGILIKTVLNNSVGATLVLDTGASAVMLKKSVAEKLGINLDSGPSDVKITVADGREIMAKHIFLKSVKVQDYEARDVEAVIPLEESGVPLIYDGLLGMSYLKNFNFKVDHKENKLILEKL
ncbi:MAG: retropepsin-like aspartic protease [Candidatus Omnitrophica bacterium]|nr:retropepsin-like aspartic protease [Candidatus Omnitrophota bacterium]